jgi:hypothetical protein
MCHRFWIKAKVMLDFLLRTYIIIPFGVLVIFIVIHLALNTYYAHFYEPPAGHQLMLGWSGAPRLSSSGNLEASHSPDEKPHVIEIAPDDMFDLTGSASWRFFQWGTLRGNSRTNWVEFLTNSWGFSESAARVFDPTNPPPFWAFFVSAIVALGLWSRKKRSEAIQHDTDKEVE